MGRAVNDMRYVIKGGHTLDGHSAVQIDLTLPDEEGVTIVMEPGDAIKFANNLILAARKAQAIARQRGN